MSDPIRMQEQFNWHEAEGRMTMTLVRSSPDVPGAKVTMTMEVVGLGRERSITYLRNARQAWTGLPSWGGGDY